MVFRFGVNNWGLILILEEDFVSIIYYFKFIYFV
ncbi:Uncharacterised protein [Streptococcus pneumoniae]|nr:Uncharacterised protein [Streptococcus pneumoniae]